MRISGLISQTYLQFLSNGMRLSPEPPRHDTARRCTVTHGTPSLCRIGFALRVWPPLRLKTPRHLWFLFVLLGNGTLGRRVAPLSVPYTYLTRVWPRANPGSSPQSASRRPVERGFVHVPRLWERRCPQRTVAGLCHKKLDVCLIFGIPSWLMPLRDRSGQSSQPFWHGVRLGSLMRFSRPLHLVPLFILSPSHTSFSSFFSCLPLLHVLSSHSSLSFARTTVWALVCTRTSTCTLRF